MSARTLGGGHAGVARRRPAGNLGGAVRQPVVFRIVVFLFVLSTTFDAFTFAFTRENETLARLLGIVLVVLYVGWPGADRPRLRVLSRELRWFYVFAAVVAAQQLYRLLTMSSPQQEFAGSLAYLQLFLMAFLLQDLTRDPRIYRSVLAVVVLAYVGLAIATSLGVSTVTYAGNESRVGVVGINLNQLAYFYAIIAVALVAWLLAEGKPLSPSGIARLAVLAFLFLGIARTGSRGGATALLTGLVVASLVSTRTRTLPKYLLLVPLFLGGATYFLATQGALAERVTRSVEEGDTGTREQILEAGLDLAHERPLMGYGTMYGRVLGRALGFSNIAAHNTYLQVQLSFGLLGFAPFVLGLLGLAAFLWRQRGSVWGGMWLAILAMTAVFGFVGHFADAKHFWILVVLMANTPVVASIRVGAATRASSQRTVGTVSARGAKAVAPKGPEWRGFGHEAGPAR